MNKEIYNSYKELPAGKIIRQDKTPTGEVILEVRQVGVFIYKFVRGPKSHLRYEESSESSENLEWVHKWIRIEKKWDFEHLQETMVGMMVVGLEEVNLEGSGNFLRIYLALPSINYSNYEKVIEIPLDLEDKYEYPHVTVDGVSI